jgi:hypothetical protein
MGDPAEIKAKRVNKQKFDREDARLLLRLLRENNFPQIWVPGSENRDLRQLPVARSSVGADAHADHESAAGVGDERRLLRASRGRRSRGRRRTTKTTLRSERRSALKKDLTEPTLLEMSALR